MSIDLAIRPPIIAHRGASAYAPENTLAAFKKAKELGAHWLEFDVRLAACGELVVFHDDTLERTSNGSGLLQNYPYSYLKTLDAGSWFHQQFAGECIPTLKTVLEFIGKHALSANIEIKALAGKEEETVARTLSVLEHYWPKHENIASPLVSSFSIEVLRALRAQSQSLQIGFLMDELYSGWEKNFQELACSSLHVNQLALDPTEVALLKKQHRPLLAYTVNEGSRALDLFSWGVDAVFSDCPDKIFQSIRPGI